MSEGRKNDEGKYDWLCNDPCLWGLQKHTAHAYGRESDEYDLVTRISCYLNGEYPEELLALARKVEPSLHTRLELVTSVLDFGARKYDRDNWYNVPDRKYRYTNAMIRHAVMSPSEWVRRVPGFYGPHDIDDESGLEHRAHFLCNLYFLLEMI